MLLLAYPLIVAHLVGDFALQTDGMIRAKMRYGPPGALPHVATVVALTLLAVLPALPRWWPYVLLIGAAHLALDVGKVAVDRRMSGSAIRIFLFWTDQLLHIVIILFAAQLALRGGRVPIWTLDEEGWIYLILFLIATFVIGILFRALAPSAEWPNRWPAAAGRGGLFLLVASGGVLLAPVPPLLAAWYYHRQGPGMSRRVRIEGVVGSIGAALLALLALQL